MSSKTAARALMVLCAGVISMGAEIKKAQAELEAKYKPRTAELEKVL